MGSQPKPTSRLYALDFTDDLKRLTAGFTGRAWVFEEIERWLANSQGPGIFLLTGEPGVGKSAIAAQLVQTRPDVAAYHFCIAGRNETIVPSTALRSLAAQLGETLPGYGVALANTIKPTHLTVDIHLDIKNMSGGQVTGVVIKHLTALDPQTELEILFRAPLAAIKAPERPKLIVIDSLDEAVTLRTFPTLVSLLAGLDQLPGWVRILCTSRPEQPVLSYFDGLSPYTLAAESAMNLEDIRQYVTYRVQKPTLKQVLFTAGKAEDTLIAQLAGKEDSQETGLVSGNFLYAKMLLNDIESGQQALTDLNELPHSLDEIYHNYLRRFTDTEWIDGYQPLFGVLSVALEPLTEAQLASFTGLKRTGLRHSLGVMRQFLDVSPDEGERFRLFHQSLRDYLVNEKRSKDFFSAAEDYHEKIASYYLQTFSDRWSECDLYGLRQLPAHLLGAGEKTELQALMGNYYWLQAKLDWTGVNSLLVDFNLERPGRDDASRKLSHAIEQAAYVFAHDSNQLAAQLLGRLLDEKNERIQALLTQARTLCRRPCLLPQTASLRQAGSLLRTLAGHAEPVDCVALTPDGKRAVSGSYDNTLKVWDLASGIELNTLKGHADLVYGVAVTRDGKLVVSASRDKTLKTWDLKRGVELRTLTGHTNYVMSVVVTPDGSRAISASGDKTLKVWDLATGLEVLTLSGHTGWVRDVAVTPDGNRAVSVSDDQTLKVWDLASGVELQTLRGHTDLIYGVAVTPDGRKVVSASSDRTLKIWDLANGAELHTLIGHKNVVYAVAITPDGNRILSASDDFNLKVWDLETGVELRTLIGHTSPVYAVNVTTDGNYAVSASEDNTLKVWDLSTAVEQESTPGHIDVVLRLALAPDGSCAVSTSRDKTLKVWELKTGKELSTLSGHTELVSEAAVTPDCKRAISASFDKTLKLWDLVSGADLFTLTGHSDAVLSVTVTPDGTRAVSSSADHTLKVWDLASGVELHTLKGHRNSVYSSVVTPDSNRAVSASSDKTLKVWDLSSGKEVFSLIGHKGPVYNVAVTQDGKRAVSASWDKTLKVWDLTSGAELFTLAGHKGPIFDVGLTPDARYAISASQDNNLKSWDLLNGRELKTFSGHTGAVSSLAVTPDGSFMISVSFDNMLKVWDLATGACLATFYTEGNLSACAATRYGDRIVTAGNSGRVHFLQFVQDEIHK